MSDYFSLDEICKKNDFVLVDTCSFTEPLTNFPHDNLSSEERLEKTIISNKNISFWLERIPSYKKIYSTEGVIDEIRNWKYDYKKAIKKPVFKKFVLKNGNTENIPKLRRELRDNNKNRINLANMLELEGRIFKMNENQKEIYGLFYEKYSSLREKFGLSEVDINLFILGTAIYRKKNTSIISNDSGIRKAWRFFLRQNIPPGKGFYFYSACGFNLFNRE